MYLYQINTLLDTTIPQQPTRNAVHTIEIEIELLNYCMAQL